MAIKGRYVPGAVKVPFVDREEVLAAFDDELAALAGTPRLLSLYGVGGIGKSRLLHELRRRTRDGRAGTVTATLNLQEPDFRSAAGGLASLRADLGDAGVTFDRFDLAYAVWWQRLHPMQPLSAAPHPWISGGETVAEIVGDVTLGAPGLGAVVKSAVVDSVRYAKDLGAGRRAAGHQDPPSSTPNASLADRADEAARNYAPKLARARAVWGDDRPVDLREVTAALTAASDA